MGRDIFFRSANAYAMQYGLIIGLIMIINLACGIGMFTAPSLGFWNMIFLISTPFVTYFFTKRYLKSITGNIQLSFTRIYIFVLLLIYYATIILTLGVFLYFAFIDKGFFINSYRIYMTSPEIQQQLNQPETQQLIKIATGNQDINFLINQLELLTPINYAYAVLSSNFIIGFIIAIPIALISKITFKNK